MSKAIERTNEIVGQLNDGDWTDHSGQNAHWSYFCEGYAQAEKDIIQRIDEIIKWPPGENEVKKIIRIEEMIREYKSYAV